MPFDATSFVETKPESEVTKALKRAKQKISDRKRWCKGEERMVQHGVVAYCAIGALSLANRDVSIDILTPARIYLDKAATANSCYHSIIGYNDCRGTTHQDIMRAFDLAIKLSEESNV